MALEMSTEQNSGAKGQKNSDQEAAVAHQEQRRTQPGTGGEMRIRALS